MITLFQSQMAVCDRLDERVPPLFNSRKHYAMEYSFIIGHIKFQLPQINVINDFICPLYRLISFAGTCPCAIAPLHMPDSFDQLSQVQCRSWVCSSCPLVISKLTNSFRFRIINGHQSLSLLSIRILLSQKLVRGRSEYK